MSKLFFYYSTMNAGKSANLLQASFNYKEQGFKTVLFTFNKDNRDFLKNTKNPFLNQEKDEKIKLSELMLDMVSKHKENDYFQNLKNKKVSSRIGISEEAYGFDNETNFKSIFESIFVKENKVDEGEKTLNLNIENKKHQNVDFSSIVISEQIISEIKKEQKQIGAIFIDEAQFLTEKQVKDLAWVVDNCNIPVLCYGLRTDFLGNPFDGSKWLLAWADELKEMKTICKTGKKATFVLRIDENGNPVKNGEQIQIGGNESYMPVSRKLHQKLLNNN